MSLEDDLLEEYAWSAHAEATALAEAAGCPFDEAMTTVLGVSDAMNSPDWPRP